HTSFPGRTNYVGHPQRMGLKALGGWFWESGFKRDPIAEVEWMRDHNFRAMYGAWDTLKNVDKLYPNHKLGWAAFIAGKRESRRLLGDVVLAGDDFRTNRVWADASFPCSWSIDLHLPDPKFQKGHEGEEFISKATDGANYKYKGPYWAPYRCLYSRNIPNLFMAGRDISVTHEALGAVRVMRTCGMMGEVVGMAASLCKQHETSPRGVYENHLDDLKKLMERGTGKTPAAKPVAAIPN
ncbi:MAG: FAD-dependent oxidoreductase, partial [Verrucomicrobia bacterium]|nr:FAD-dependent oxidoreductase [Verrucomicrobiota bacterium]